MNAEKVFEQVWREFIRRLEALRNQKPKMTYEQLGEMCGVSKVTTKRWLEGARWGKDVLPGHAPVHAGGGMNIRAVIPQSNLKRRPSWRAGFPRFRRSLPYARMRSSKPRKSATHTNQDGKVTWKQSAPKAATIRPVLLRMGKNRWGKRRIDGVWDRRCMPRRIFASFRQMMFRKADAVAGGTFYFLSYVKVTSFAGKVLFRSLA